MKNFKDSGIEWLGEIPEHWEVVKIKFLAIFYTGDSIKDSEKHKYCFSSNSIPYIATKDIDINTNVVDYNNGMFIEKLNTNFKRAYGNSILLCLEGANAGKKIAFLNKEVCFVNKLCYVNSKSKKLISKFLFYFLQSVFFKNIFLSNIKGLIGGITTEQLGNFCMLLPSLKEQEQIANFLDEKCEQIKNFIEKKEKLISLLKEQKQALINGTITKGLDKNVTFKDSDIEWLEEIPQHWNILKLKHIASLRNQKSNNIDFRIGLENIESKTGKFIPSSEVVFEEDGIGFKKGDILFGKLRPYLAKVFLTDRDGICVSEFLVLKIKSESNKFIKFLMLSSLFIDIVDSSTYGTKMPRANWEFIGNLKIPLPPLKEQEQIAKFLDEKCEKIDLLIEKTKKQIKLIKEYKTTLINQAVCGRIDL
ncbi:TPA: restriction endonuclease subunit S [Campylobacter coli]|nr:restriction endonuclease subunit S [Campylobacter coli]